MSDGSGQNVTMPKWPAWVLFGTMAACAYPAVTASAPRTEVAAGATDRPVSQIVATQPSGVKLASAAK